MTFFVTFYSFKGGVGRTLALANVAWSLAHGGKKVVLIDLDLEAPALLDFEEFKLRGDGLKKGFLEYAARYAEDGSCPPIREHVHPCKESPGAGQLWVMPSGEEMGESYAQTLAHLSWRRLHPYKGTRPMIEGLRQALSEEIQPEYVLIDSRTGFSDVGGLSTQLLADMIVLVFNVTRGCIVGSIRAYRSFVQESSRARKRIQLVASPVPQVASARDSLVDQRIEQAMEHMPGLTQPIRIFYEASLVLAEELVVRNPESFAAAERYHELRDLILRAAERARRSGSGLDVHAVVIQGDAVQTVVITGDGNTVITGSERISDAKPELLLEAWLHRQTSACQRLPLGIIDSKFVRDGGEHQVGLAEVYVDLDVTTPPRPEEEDDSRGWSWRLVRGEGPGRRPLLEALAEGQRHVLLGDPGSGKTTFAHYLCQALASKENVPEAFAGLLPIRFVLREVMARLDPSADGAAKILWSALEADLVLTLGAQGAKTLLPHLRNRLLMEGGMIVLDGLDEVPAAQREVLLKAVQEFADQLAGGRSHILVTARPYAYAEHWRLEGFRTLALAPFDEGQVRRFVEQWYQVAARRVFEWNEETARDRGRRLLEAIEARPYLGDLGSRPLLLTLMATLHSSWGQLPEDRASLYEETVRLLLSRWQRAREVKTSSGEMVMEQSIAQVLEVAEDRLRGALDHLAYTVHERQGRESQSGDEPADISQAELLVSFEPLLGELSPDNLLGYLKDRAGLLVERREGIYAFPHRSFQEYLAASYLNSLPEPAEEIRQRAFENPIWWREVVLLALGRGKFSGIGNAVSLLRELQNADPPPTDQEEASWRVAVLCGLAIVELRLLAAEKDRPHYGAVIERARRWLVALIEGGRLAAKERLEAGEVLAELGDPRKGVGLVGSGEAAVPSIDWVEISAGDFTMGSAAEDDLASGWERPEHSLHLGRYWIGRFPVTNAQFRPFVEGDGYSKSRYWTEEGWAWRQGEEPEPDLSSYPESLHEQVREWLAKRPAEKRNRPFSWDDRRLSMANRPVIGVSWYEVLAFARWLQGRYCDLGMDPVGQSGIEGWQVRLPSEAEWEKAARGSEGQVWPWAGRFEAAHCNTKESELGIPSAVGLFPANRSPFGVVDTSGNVWEWTTTVWEEKKFSYPYEAKDGREDSGGNIARVLRGGSYYTEKKLARCAARSGYFPGYFINYIGFRLVLSPGVF